MQVKVTLTESEQQTILCWATDNYWPSNTTFTKLAAKLAKAIQAPAKPMRKASMALWQLIGRTDLKAKLVQDERFHWSVSDGFLDQCAHCGGYLGIAGDRVTPVSKWGSDFKLAHDACALPFWYANSPYAGYGQGPESGIGRVECEPVLHSYTEEETANTAGMARSLAKAA